MGMLQGGQGFDGRRQPSAGDQGVFAHLGIVAGMGGLSVNRHLKAVTAAKAHSHVVIPALAHDGIVRVDHILRYQLVGALAQTLLVRHKAGQDLSADFVGMGSVIGQGLQKGGQSALHVHGATAIDLAVDLRGNKGVRLPAVGHIHRVQMADEQHRLSGAAAVQHRPHRGPLPGGILFKVAVMGLHPQLPQYIGHIVRHSGLVTVDGANGDHVIPAL